MDLELISPQKQSQDHQRISHHPIPVLMYLELINPQKQSLTANSVFKTALSPKLLIDILLLLQVLT